MTKAPASDTSRTENAQNAHNGQNGENAQNGDPLQAALPMPYGQSPGNHEQKQAAKAWFWRLRDAIIDQFEAIEREYANASLNDQPHHLNQLNQNQPDQLNQNQPDQLNQPTNRFTITPWQRPQGGGGEMAKMTGQVFEKVGVNVSQVWGAFKPEFAKTINGAAKDPKFWACGISLVAHMRNPKVPAVHMNTRMICTTKSWFGGGADLTPMVPNDKDTARFHEALKDCCARHKGVADYPAFKAWCDRYFYLPHRNEPRGVGGIFYDALDNGDWNADFAFTKDVGETFTSIYPALVRAHMHDPFTGQDRQHQLERRGRYVEFNLIHDRGTLFGLKTDGNVDAILMSMPPMAAWS